MNNLNKRGQVTIFIIIAIVIVAAVGLYFVFKGVSTTSVEIPENLEPVYNNFLECVEQDVLTGASLLETQGGYIELPEFEPGSSHMPFSSQLNVLGNPVPYWYYVSGNGFDREQVPSRNDMESHLEEFVESRVRDCEFQEYRQEGFSVDLGEPNANARIDDGSIEIGMSMDMGLEKGDESVFVRNHNIEVNSRLGELHDSALEVYETQQDELFLEERGLDVLGSYAPLDGLEIQCSPLTWHAEEVVGDLQEAIEVNTLALNTNPQKYYDLELPVQHEVRFLNSQRWPSTYEVAPNDGDFLVSNPVGNQPGLGVLGFCYVPYHFTYNMRYPTLVQVYDEENPTEIFQFPMAVVIEGNQPREPTNADAYSGPESQLCEFRNTPTSVKVLDSNLNSIDNAVVSYECLGQKCSIGQTENGELQEDFPQCANGYIIANAEGYEKSEYLFSTIESGSIEIILDRIYEKRVDVRVDENTFDGNAVITFTSDDKVETLLHQEDKIAELSEGSYEVDVKIYEESELNLGAKTVEQCIDVPRGAILGTLGLTEERCFDVEVPEQKISPALVGGGSTEVFVSENDLSSEEILEISVPRFDAPESMEDIQINNVLYENSEAEVRFV